MWRYTDVVLAQSQTPIPRNWAECCGPAPCFFFHLTPLQPRWWSRSCPFASVRTRPPLKGREARGARSCCAAHPAGTGSFINEAPGRTGERSERLVHRYRITLTEPGKVEMWLKRESKIKIDHFLFQTDGETFSYLLISLEDKVSPNVTMRDMETCLHIKLQTKPFWL